MRASIRVRILAWYVVLLACVFMLVATLLLLRLHADLIRATDHSLRPALNQIATGYQREGLSEFHDQSATVLAEERPPARCFPGAAGSFVPTAIGWARGPSSLSPRSSA